MADFQYNIADMLQGFGTGFAAGSRLGGGQISYIGRQMSAAQASFEGDMAALAMQERAWRFLQQGERMHSTQVVSAAAAGVALDSQTFLDIQTETRQNFMEEAQRMFNQAEITRNIGRANAATYQFQAQAERGANMLGFWAETIKGATGLMRMWGGGSGE